MMINIYGNKLLLDKQDTSKVMFRADCVVFGGIAAGKCEEIVQDSIPVYMNLILSHLRRICGTVDVFHLQNRRSKISNCTVFSHWIIVTLPPRPIKFRPVRDLHGETTVTIGVEVLLVPWWGPPP